MHILQYINTIILHQEFMIAYSIVGTLACCTYTHVMIRVLSITDYWFHLQSTGTNDEGGVGETTKCCKACV